MSYNGNSSAHYVEPRLKSGSSYGARWRYWYPAIADIMIRNPKASHPEIAKELGKHPNTISIIVHTDMFKEYFHQRREEWRKDHDHAIRAKMTDVGEAALDIVLEQLQSKRSQIPMKVALQAAESVLDRLGYAPVSGPTVVVDNSVHDNRSQSVTVQGLSATDLEEARAALRRSEQMREGSSLAPPSTPGPVLEQGAGLEVLDVSVESP